MKDKLQKLESEYLAKSDEYQSTIASLQDQIAVKMSANDDRLERSKIDLERKIDILTRELDDGKDERQKVACFFLILFFSPLPSLSLLHAGLCQKLIINIASRRP